jgi:hypothetical protein
MSIFPTGALLQINVTSFVGDEHVDGAMTQVIPMHLRAARMSQDAVIFVDDWELLTIR